jgi:chaperonin cofactor prefoldin
MALTKEDLAAIEKLMQNALKPVTKRLDSIDAKLNTIDDRLEKIETRLDKH